MRPFPCRLPPPPPAGFPLEPQAQHLKDKYPAAKTYYDRHFALRKRAPGGYTASTYSTVRVLLDTAREVKSLDTEKVTQALEGRKFQYQKGPEQIRACDHVNIQDVYLCKSKSAAAMKNDWDSFDIVQGVSGELTSESCARARASIRRSR